MIRLLDAEGRSEAVRDLYPGIFALVMATGIVSNAFWLLDGRAFSDALYAVALVAYPLLVVATALRAVRFGRHLRADATNPALVFSFFTFVAGTDVLGVALHLRGQEAAATALWLAALAVWVFLGYFSFGVLTVVSGHRSADVVHGGWLIAVVGTQSLVLLGTLLAPGFGPFAPHAYLLTHCLWGVGLVLYGIFITLFAYRIFFEPLDPAAVNPLFWVVMGAAAISANAGSCLIVSKPILPFLATLRPFVEGSTLILWAWGTWWIPLLVVLGVWKHVVRRVPFVYHPSNWSLVFPLGMYTVATIRLSLAADYAPLRDAPKAFVWVAFAAWLLAFVGLLKRWLTPRSAPAEGA